MYAGTHFSFSTDEHTRSTVAADQITFLRETLALTGARAEHEHRRTGRD